MNCKCCDRVMTNQEQATYLTRCEDCWCRPGGNSVRTSVEGAASCYSNAHFGRIGEISTRYPEHFHGQK